MSYKLAFLLGLSTLVVLMVDQVDSVCCRSVKGWCLNWSSPCKSECADGTKEVAEEAHSLLELLHREQERISWEEENAMVRRTFQAYADQNLKLSNQNAQEMLEKMRGKADINNLPADWFASVDTNGNGYIDPEEFDSDMAAFMDQRKEKGEKFKVPARQMHHGKNKMADIEGNLKTISKAIQTTQRLRGSVGRVFSQLRDGMEGGETAGERSKAFLDQLRENLLAVNKEYDELEKLSTAVTKQSDQLPTGSSGLLSLDPVQDKTPLYGQLLQSYKWSNKVHEHAGYTAQLLNQNSLKRSSMMTGLSTKRRKPQSTSHALPGQYVDAVVANLQRHFPNMNITMTRPFGQSAVLQIGLGRTLQAIVVLRGLLIDRVVVKGFQENITQEDGKLDIWSKSQFKVFEK
ncbi:Mediator of RNA polymerase II transcription subunit 27, partial [Branchiostoma belcheri]